MLNDNKFTVYSDIKHNSNACFIFELLLADFLDLEKMQLIVSTKK